MGQGSSSARARKNGTKARAGFEYSKEPHGRVRAEAVRQASSNVSRGAAPSSSSRQGGNSR